MNPRTPGVIEEITEMHEDILEYSNTNNTLVADRQSRSRTASLDTSKIVADSTDSVDSEIQANSARHSFIAPTAEGPTIADFLPDPEMIEHTHQIAGDPPNRVSVDSSCASTILIHSLNCSLKVYHASVFSRRTDRW